MSSTNRKPRSRPHVSLRYEITANGLRRVSYEQTEHYAVAKRFLNDSNRQLEILLR
jgi:predicted ATPase